MTSVHKRVVTLKKGDVVRVKTGELRDLLGDVDSVSGKVVVIRYVCGLFVGMGVGGGGCGCGCKCGCGY